MDNNINNKSNCVDYSNSETNIDSKRASLRSKLNLKVSAKCMNALTSRHRAPFLNLSRDNRLNNLERLAMCLLVINLVLSVSTNVVIFAQASALAIKQDSSENDNDNKLYDKSAKQNLATQSSIVANGADAKKPNYNEDDFEDLMQALENRAKHVKNFKNLQMRYGRSLNTYPTRFA